MHWTLQAAQLATLHSCIEIEVHMDTLANVFQESINREGKEIVIDGINHTVLFRRTTKGETTPYTLVFAPYSDSIKQGASFTINGDTYLILKENTIENNVYRKYEAIKCSAIVKMMYGVGDIVSYPVYMNDLSDSLNSGKIVTVASTAEFIFSLNDDSRRLYINQRFFCGYFGLAWKITDINYKDGMAYVYATRDATQSTDDKINGIADRWNYEMKPSTYQVVITEDAVALDVAKTQTLTVSVLKDGTAMETTPTITWTVADATIASIDSTNTITALKQGTTKITGSYHVTDNDTIITDSVTATITQSVVIGNIVITPSYNSSSCYNTLTGQTKTFTASISGVTSPQWTITLNSNNVVSSCYVSTINNSAGTFVVNNKAQSNYQLIYTISEAVSGKSTTYNIKLGGML